MGVGIPSSRDLLPLLNMFLVCEHISISTWAKERANPCASVQFSILPNQIINNVGLSVVGSDQCLRGEGGRPGSRVGGPLATFFWAADQLPKEFYGQLGTADKMLFVKSVPASYTPKELFLQNKTTRPFKNHMEGHFSQVLFFLDGASLPVGLDCRGPSQRPLPTPTSVSCTHILWGNLGCVHNIRVKVRKMRNIAKQPFQVAKMDK